jgi:hypothetical protein
MTPKERIQKYLEEGWKVVFEDDDVICLNNGVMDKTVKKR